MTKERCEIAEVESLCLEFGEALLNAVSEKESSGEIPTAAALQIYLRLSAWQRQLQELYSIARQRRLL